MIAHVALPLPIDKAFSYAVPELLSPFCRPLTRVKVPFRHRSLVGFVVDTEDGPAVGLKEIQAVVDCVPLIDEVCFDLCRWASRHYFVPIGLVLKYALSSTISLERYCRHELRPSSCAHLDGLSLKRACVVAGRLHLLDYINRSAVGLGGPLHRRAPRRRHASAAQGAIPPRLFVAPAEERARLYTSLVSAELARGGSSSCSCPITGPPAPFSPFVPGELPRRGLLVREPDARKKAGRDIFQARAKGGCLILGNKACVFLPRRR